MERLVKTMEKRQIVLQVESEVLEDGGRVVAVIEGRELTRDQEEAILVDGAEVVVTE